VEELDAKEIGKARVNRMDENDDGSVDAKEFKAFKELMKRHRAAKKGPLGAKVREVREIADMMDSNGDGTVSSKELRKFEASLKNLQKGKAHSKAERRRNNSKRQQGAEDDDGPTQSQSDPTCSRGIEKKLTDHLKISAVAICCSKLCGTCGGKRCATMPMAKSACCPAGVVSTKRSCNSNPAPCLIRELSAPPGAKKQTKGGKDEKKHKGGKAQVGIGAEPSKTRQDFNTKDKNGDGKLDAKEIGKARVNKMDANDDGGVDAKEFKAFKERMKKLGEQKEKGTEGKAASKSHLLFSEADIKAAFEHMKKVKERQLKEREQS
jgi:Ca2+-binding EF-hand superfamily protein